MQSVCVVCHDRELTDNNLTDLGTSLSGLTELRIL